MKKIATFIILTTISLNIMAQQKIVQTAGRTQLGEFAPEFAHLNDDILFGEVWSRNDLLSLREMFFPIYAKYFKGNSYPAQISDSQIPFFNVTFEPGCRNNWHTHHATKGGGQMLVGVAGRGWYQEEGKPAQ